MPVSNVRHLHIDVISLHDAVEVLIVGKNSMESMIIDVSYNHLGITKRVNELALKVIL